MKNLDELLAKAEAAKELAAKAIEGPWRVTDDDFDYNIEVVEDPPSWGTLVVAENCNQGENGETAAFIADARSTVPALADAVIDLVDENRRLRAAWQEMQTLDGNAVLLRVIRERAATITAKLGIES